MNQIEAKTILQRVNHPSEMWFHTDYNMNLYKGCSHGCIYCDSRSENYQIENFSEVRSKKNAIQILEDELSRKKIKGTIGMGAMSDPYNPLEKTALLTRSALELILKYGYGVSIATKSDLILRDIDLLSAIAKKNVCHVSLTITTPNDDLCKKIEPYVAVSSRRFEVVKQLKENGIVTGILMMPILPFINDTLENIDGMIFQANRAKADYIYPFFGVTLRNIQRDYYYQQLDILFPGLKTKYQQTYHNQYECDSPKHRELYAYFAEAMKHTTMLSSMKDINKLLKPRQEPVQLSLMF
ncbi:MAG: radical SAM protein [Candidatus Izemoplasmatales bacterium]